MTQQFDMLGLPLDDATMRHITGKVSFPVPREVRKRRLYDVLNESRFGPGHRIELHGHGLSADELQRALQAVVAVNRDVVIEFESLDDAVERHASFDIGHELILPERARSDHR